MIVEQLQQIAVAEGEPSLVQYVIEACQARRAFCFSPSDKSGWLIVQPVPLPVPHLLVIAAYCLGGNAIARYEGSVFALARHLELNKVRFRSHRKGYQRVMPQRGWQLLADKETWEYNLG